MGEITIRAGGEADHRILLGLFDAAVEWLVARGRSAQWGTEPWSGDAKKEERVRSMARDGEVYIAEIDGSPVGALVLGDRLDYAPPVGEPEVYVNLLLSEPAHRGSGIGTALLEFARQRTREQGISLLRVDCWSGGDRRLVAYYESQGFTPTVDVSVRGTSAQVFQQRLQPTKDP